MITANLLHCDMEKLKETLRFKSWELSAKLPPDWLLKVQQHKLKQLILYAQNEIDYYQQTLGSDPIDLQDFTSLPTTSRKIIQTDGKRMVNYDLPIWMYRNRNGTSGSTGEPVQFYRSTFGAESVLTQAKYTYSNLFRAVVQTGHPINRVLKHMKSIEIRTPGPDEAEYVKLTNASNLKFIDEKRLVSEPENVVEEVINYGTEIFGCYGSVTLAFCQAVEKHGYKGTLSIPYILNVGEFITPEQFEKYEAIGKDLGFRHVESGALVRSSYKAHKHIH